MFSLYILFNIMLKALTRAIRHVKGDEWDTNRKGIRPRILSCNDMVLYTETLKTPLQTSHS